MRKKIICFDLDGTLVDDTIFIWETLHDHIGTDAIVRADLKKRFYSGKLSYHEWASLEIEEWKRLGADKTIIEEAITQLQLMPGARETLEELKRRGHILSVVSGSIQIVLEKTLPDYRRFFSDILINHLDFDKVGKIVRIRPTKYDMEQKAAGLILIAKRHRMSTKECIFIGDHDNDLAIAKEAGVSISFNSKSKELDRIADHIVKGKDLRNILPIIASY